MFREGINDFFMILRSILPYLHINLLLQVEEFVPKIRQVIDWYQLVDNIRIHFSSWHFVYLR